MDRDELFVPESTPEAYEPQTPVVDKSNEDYERFWNQLIEEADEADRIALEGGRIIEAPVEEDVVESLPFEERYERLMAVVANKPSHREILLRILATCIEVQPLDAMEAAIEAYPEFPAAGQNPFRLITFLVDGGGLDLIAMDAEGSPIDFERKIGLTEDEADDLVAGFSLRTTDVGHQVAEDHTTHRRMDDLFTLLSDRVSYYTELLEFCKQPRTFKDIEALFQGRDLSGLRTLHPESGLAIKPSVFVDNMEKAGAIVWGKDGWILTEGGGAYLESIVRGSM